MIYVPRAAIATTGFHYICSDAIMLLMMLQQKHTTITMNATTDQTATFRQRKGASRVVFWLSHILQSGWTRAVLGLLVVLCLLMARPVMAAEKSPRKVPQAAITKLAETFEPPADREGYGEKVRRYSRVIRMGREYALEYADAPNLYEVHRIMLLALQARVNLESDARTYRMLLDTARKMLKSEAPPEDKLEADLVLLREKFRQPDEKVPDKWRLILDFAGRYDDTDVGARALMYASKTAESEQRRAVLNITQKELRFRPEYWDEPGANAFLVRRTKADLSGRTLNAVMKPIKGGVLRAPRDLLGKVTILLFWAGSSPSSLDGIEVLKRFYRKHKERVQIVGVSLDSSREDLHRSLKAHDLPWIQTFSGRGLNDPTARSYGVQGLPTVIYLDPLGRCRRLRGMKGHYGRRPSTKIRGGYGNVVRTAKQEMLRFETLHDVVHNYLSGEFLLRMNTGLFSRAAARSQKIPDKKFIPLAKLIQSLPNTPSTERKVALARKVLETGSSLEDEYPDAPEIYAVRNGMMVAARVLWLRTKKKQFQDRARRLAKAVSGTEPPQPAGLFADYLLTGHRIAAGAHNRDLSEREIGKFMDRHEGGKAGTAAAILGSLLAVEAGDDAMIQVTGDEVQKQHGDSPQARSYLRYVLDRQVEIGRRFEAELTRMDGGSLVLPQDLKGKVGVVCFWDAESMRKYEALPERPEYRRRHRVPYPGLSPSEHEDLTVIGVNLDESREDAEKVINEKHPDWIHTRPEKGWNHELLKELDIYSLPSIWIIGRDGRIVADDMLSAHSRSPILAAALHQPSPATVRARVVAQWRVLGPFHQRKQDSVTETGYWDPPDWISTTPAQQSWMDTSWMDEPWHGKAKARRFSSASFPPTRAATELDFDAMYDDGEGGKVGWRIAEADSSGFIDLDAFFEATPALPIGYAVSYVFSPTGGKYECAFTNTGMGVLRVNGEEFFRAARRAGKNRKKVIWPAGQRVRSEWGERKRYTKMPVQNRTLYRDYFEIKLRKGWNEIYLKTWDVWGDWRFQLKICDPQRTLQYALAPEYGPRAYPHALPRWEPPEEEDTLRRFARMMDGPNADVILASASALGETQGIGGRFGGFVSRFRRPPRTDIRRLLVVGSGGGTIPARGAGRCIDTLMLLHGIHALDLWKPSKHFRKSWPDLTNNEIALNALKPDKLFNFLMEAFRKTEEKDQRSYRKRSIVRALGLLGDKRAIPVLVEELEREIKRNPDQKYVPSNSNTPLLESLFKALGRLGGPKAAQALLPFLDDERRGFRMAAMKSLVRVGHKPSMPEIVKALDECNKLRYGDQIIHEMGLINHPAAVRWLEQETHKRLGKWPLEENDESEPVNALGYYGKTDYLRAVPRIKALARFGGDRVVDELLAYLRHKQRRVRQHAIRALGRVGARQAVPALLAELSDPASIELRHFVVQALEKIGDPRATDALIKLLGNDSYGLRILAARALRSTDAEKKSVTALIEVLKDDHWLVRTTAAETLGILEAPSAVGALKKALDDGSSSVRGAAAEALGELKATGATEALVHCLPDWEVGRSAARALDKFGWRPAGAKERVHYLVARRRGRDLLEDWPAARRVLLADLQGGGRAATNAAFALVALGKARVIPRLKAFLDATENPAVAVAFLNSGHDELEKHAKAWAEKRHRQIDLTRCASPVSWKGWR